MFWGHSIRQMCFTIECAGATISICISGWCQPDPANFPFELDPGAFLDPGADEFAEILDVGRAGRTQVDQEIAVHLRDLGLAEFEPAAARPVDELPGLLARRVLEGRPSGDRKRTR